MIRFSKLPRLSSEVYLHLSVTQGRTQDFIKGEFFPYTYSDQQGAKNQPYVNLFTMLQASLVLPHSRKFKNRLQIT